MNFISCFKNKRFILLCTFFLYYSAKGNGMEFQIATTWDGQEIDHDAAKISLFQGANDSIQIKISAPFFNDPPPPGGIPGKPYNQLWNFEVVEAFFLGTEDKYLEVEFAPHGEHIILLLSGPGNAIKMCLPCDYEAKINGDSWHGVATIPSSYFPPSVNRFNAYAIHGVGENRVYEALNPVPRGHFEHPNFHRLEFFRYVDFSSILPHGPPSSLSKVWEEALKHKNEPLSC